VVRVFRDIHDVDPLLWDSLLDPDDLLASHRYVSVCQDSGAEGDSSWHLLVMDGEELVATTSLSSMVVSLDLLTVGGTRRVIRAIRRIRPGFLKIPTLFCGLPVSTGYSAIRFAEHADPVPALVAVANEMSRIAESEGIGLLCFKEFFPGETPVMDQLLSRGFWRGHSLPFCSMPITWCDYQDYLSSLTTGYRHQITGTARRLDRSGVRIRQSEDFASLADQFVPLYEEVMDHAPFQLERLNRQYFELLFERLPDEAGLLVAETESAPAAALATLRSPGCLTSHFAGIDYGRRRETGAYVGLLQELVQIAIATGCRWVDLGQNSYYLKARMGARCTPLYVYLRHRRPLLNRLLALASPAIFPSTPLPSLNVFRRA
jgi:predicted N-acyltransferase